MRAIRSYLIEECRVQQLTSSADHLVVTPEEELAEFEESNRLNAEWNAAIAVEREQRLARKLAERKEFILKRLELKEEREAAALQEAEEIVRREKVIIMKNCFVDIVFIQNNGMSCEYSIYQLDPTQLWPLCGSDKNVVNCLSTLEFVKRIQQLVEHKK